MKLPAVAIAAAFACGIALGLCPPLATFAPSHSFLAGGFILAAVLIAAGMLLTGFRQLALGASLSMMSWTLLSILSAGIAQQPLPPDHVVTLLDAGRLDLHSPLRWRGTLRDEPARLPWGFGCELELSGVDVEGTTTAARGGLRFSFAPRDGQPSIADLHVGDEVAVTTEARRPQVFRDAGAFDRRAYLATQGIDLTATLRAPELIEGISKAHPTSLTMLATLRRRLRETIDSLFDGKPEVAGVLRAMLLGDRSFVDRDEAIDFQKTGVFHVLVVAGLHVGALAALLFWLGRRLRLSPIWTTLLTVTVLAAYVAIVEQRPPVLRAALMVAAVALGSLFYRRLDLLNSTGVAALILLIARPLALRDSSFQLSFVAIGCIAGLALPWLARTSQPYAKAMRGWRDVTRDVAHDPRAAQFRIDVRASAKWISARMPRRLATTAQNGLAATLALTFCAWELFVLTVVLQVGMLPLMALNFHRVTLSAPFVNLLALPLTCAIVPLGFLTTTVALIFPALGRLIAPPLGWLTVALLHIVTWFSRFPRASYRIPGPHVWLIALFFAIAAILILILRLDTPWQTHASLALTAALLACATLVAIFPFSPRRSAGKLEATILDVGQGDSIFIVSPQGQTLLIDGGGAFRGFPGHEQRGGTDPSEDAVSPYLWSRGYQRIDVVALTHAHQDHLGGLLAILDNFHVGKLWIGREVASTALTILEEVAHAKQIPIEHEVRGLQFSWSGVDGEFFWPPTPSLETAGPPKNNDSLVLRLRYGNRTILLPGDAEKDMERTLLSENGEQELQSDVLKVGHHGSKNSTMPDFLLPSGPRWRSSPQEKKIPTAIQARSCWNVWNPPVCAFFAPT
jgi:competence protein ComEC